MLTKGTVHKPRGLMPVMGVGTRGIFHTIGWPTLRPDFSTANGFPAGYTLGVAHPEHHSEPFHPNPIELAVQQRHHYEYRNVRLPRAPAHRRSVALSNDSVHGGGRVESCRLYSPLHGIERAQEREANPKSPCNRNDR